MPLVDLLEEAGFGLLTDQDWQTLSREGGLALGNSAGEAGFGFLTDQYLQKLSREVGLALGDSAGEAGFGFLTDQHLKTLSREVGLALGDWAGEPGFGLHHRLSEEDCLVAGYSPRPEETFVVDYSPVQHLIF